MRRIDWRVGSRGDLRIHRVGQDIDRVAERAVKTSHGCADKCVWRDRVGSVAHVMAHVKAAPSRLPDCLRVKLADGHIRRDERYPAQIRRGHDHAVGGIAM